MTNLTDHNANDRIVTNALIDLSEAQKYTDQRDALKTISNDWNEAVNGWKSVTPSPRLVLHSNTNPAVKKRRTVERALTDLHYNNHVQEDYWSSSSADYKAAVRCVGDDFESFPIPPWKSNVEQGTYRYIPDNGSYRTMKFMWDDKKEWYTIRKRHPEKVSTTWHHSCKKMQREMKRQLKKDLNGNNENEPGAVKEVESSSGNTTSRSDKQEKREKSEKHEKHLYRKEPRVRSTQSDSATVNSGKMKPIMEVEAPVPQFSIPGPLIKSASDLFIENFSSRLTALEEEMKKDSKWLRKTGEDITKLNTSRSKYREQTRPNLKESLTANNTPRMPLKTETLTTDIFSVRQVGQELKPLEKTKNLKFGNQNGGDFNHTVPNYGGAELDRTINNYKVAIENTKQSLFNTLTGTKIHTQSSKKPPKGFSVPSTITICDKSNNAQSGSTNENISAMGSVKVKREASVRKAPIQGILPEISGKRLEVSTISHRLL